MEHIKDLLEPLFVYDLNKETGEIKKYTVTEYKVIMRGYSGEAVYMYSIKGNHYECRACNLDKLVNSKLVTFEDNDTANYAKIVDSLKSVRDEAMNKAKRFDDLLEKIVPEIL